MLKIISQNFNGTGKKVFLGDCRTFLDDPQSHGFASDATQLAQIVENGKEISPANFLKVCDIQQDISRGGISFWINETVGLYWMYDENTDIHYFYA